MKRVSAAVIVFGILFGAPMLAQQKPSAAAERAGQERLIRQAAEQAAAEAEAAARAQRKVAEEARRQDQALIREEEAKANMVVPIDLEVVISRYQGDKKTSSLPYALIVNTKSVPMLDLAPTASLRMGGEVPLPMMAPLIGDDGKPMFMGGSPVQYKRVGTDIDARGRVLDGGRFEVWVGIEDNAIATPQSVGASPATSLPVIRSFQASNTLILRDGQTRQFTAAADRITGEVVKVDVTIKIAK